MTQFRTKEGHSRRLTQARKRREAKALRLKNSPAVKHPNRIKTFDGPGASAKCPDCRKVVVFDIDRATRLIQIDPKTRELHVC